MAAPGYTPVSLYYSNQHNHTPDPTNLVYGELAINIYDGKLYYKDNSGNLQIIAGNGGAGVVAGANTQIQFNNNGIFGADSTFVWTSTGLGVGTSSPAVKLVVNSTDAVGLPVGTTLQRPTGATGYIRFNEDITKFEGYNGTEWAQVGGGATGGGGDSIFWENGQTVTTNYTITTGMNAGTFGPIQINAGVTVTVPDGSVWTIV